MADKEVTRKVKNFIFNQGPVTEATINANFYPHFPPELISESLKELLDAKILIRRGIYITRAKVSDYIKFDMGNTGKW